MEYRVVSSEVADRDLDAILQYLAGELCNPSAATTLMEAVRNCLEKLRCMPFMYAQCQHPMLAAHRYRKAILGKGYLFIYRVDEQESVVYIARYFSQLEDYAERIL